MAIEAGDERRWILLPGTLCTGAVFDPFLDALGVPVAARQVVELRHPAVEDYLPELAALADPRAVICGFSLGAIVAAHLADRVAAADCLFFGLNPHADAPAKRQGRLDLAVDVARLGGSAALAARLGPLAGPEPEAARSAPKGRVMPLKDLGHYALVEDPVACASAVNALWGRA
jgi:pimeloyl-ACP methyl ester carboxylesterase